MKKAVFLTVLMVFGLVLFAGCATMQTWPDNERSAENKMVVIQEKIGDGLKSGALSPDQSQSFLTRLKGIRTDYEALRDKRVYREDWDSLFVRLDALGDEINRALSRTTRIEEPREPRNGDRIVALQRRIDDGRPGSAPATRTPRNSTDAHPRTTAPATPTPGSWPDPRPSAAPPPDKT